MHILILNHYSGSPSYGMEFRPYYLAQEWLKLGHQVTIVAANNSHIRRVTPEPKGNIWEENVEGIRYIWLKSRSYAGNGVGRMLNMLDYIRGLYKNMKDLAALKPDVVVASNIGGLTQPFEIGNVGWILNELSSDSLINTLLNIIKAPDQLQSIMNNKVLWSKID